MDQRAFTFPLARCVHFLGLISAGPPHMCLSVGVYDDDEAYFDRATFALILCTIPH